MAGHRPRAGRRDRLLRPGAPGRDRPAEGGPRARRDGAAVPFARARERGRATHDAGRLLARRLGLRRARARRARRGRACPCCSTARRARRRARRRRARSTAPPTPPPARSGCAAPTAPGCSTSRPRWRERIRAVAPSYISFEDTTRGLDVAATRTTPAATTRRRSRARSSRCRLAALACSSATGFDDVLARAARWPPTLARGSRRPATRSRPRGDSTLVAWEDADPEATRDRLAEAGIVVRNLPGRAARCAPPSAPGTTSRTSSACSAALSRTRRPGAASAPRPRIAPRTLDRQVNTCLCSSSWATSSRPWRTPRAARSSTSWPSATARRSSRSARGWP